MIYAISDIHGRYDKYKELLRKLNLDSDDTLYVLGDAIDRGPDGFKILLDMASHPNVVGLMGNHEAMALDALPGLTRCIYKGEKELTEDELNAVDLWFYNGGEISLADFLWLDADDAQCVWDYMNSMPLYSEVEAGGRRFILLHGGLRNFSVSRPLEEYETEEILWCRPEPDTAYYPNRYVVVGHTPTQFLYAKAGEQLSSAKFFKTDSFIDIDCGCAYGDGRLGCLCLDTMEEIYV